VSNVYTSPKILSQSEGHGCVLPMELCEKLELHLQYLERLESVDFRFEVASYGTSKLILGR